MAFWQPQPGPQTYAATCPADVIMFGGTRGGGKSDCAIGRQLRGAELHGPHWNGLMVRRKYKDFAEIRRRFDDLIREGLPAERTGGDQQTNYIKFSNGSKVTLAAIQILAQVDDFLGHQYCVAEGTKILMADGNGMPIENIKIGDLVQTLEGPKRILRKALPYKTECVKLTSPFGEQIHPLTHPFLTSFGWKSYASLLETYSKESERSPQESLAHQTLNVFARLLKPYPDEFERLFRRSTESRKAYISSTLSHDPTEDHEPSRMGLLRPFEPFPQFLDCISSPEIGGVSSCVPTGLEIAQDFRGGCFPCSRSHDEPSLYLKETSQDGIPSRGGVEVSFPVNYKLDAQGSIPLHVRPCEHSYEHPYTGQERIANEESFFYPCSMTPCGERIVHDLTVEDVNHYISYEARIVNKNTEISIEEATSIPFITRLIDKLKACLRSPHGVPCRMFLTGNPGGAGANSIKMAYIKKSPPNKPFVDSDGQSAIFIPSSLADNKILCDNDPSYVNRLRSIKDPALRAAWLLGDWDAYIGQAFSFSRDFHVIPRAPIPDNAPIYMTFDWGWSAPFSVGWWWVDQDGRIIRFAEWYGWDGETPNIGRKMVDPDIASGIISRENRMGVDPNRVIRLASHDCWNRKPNYQGGGQGPSTAEVFAAQRLYLVKADPGREQKIRQFRERLAVNFTNLDQLAGNVGLKSSKNDVLGSGWTDSKGLFIDEKKLLEIVRGRGLSLKHTTPMMLIYENCEHFIRTIPDLCMDENNIEDIDTEQEDHVYDEAAQICMARPITPIQPPKPKTIAQAWIDGIEKPQMDDYEEHYRRESAITIDWMDNPDRPAEGMFNTVD